MAQYGWTGRFTYAVDDWLGIGRRVHRTGTGRRQRLRVHVELHGVDDQLVVLRQVRLGQRMVLVLLLRLHLLQLLLLRLQLLQLVLLVLLQRMRVLLLLLLGGHHVMRHLADGIVELLHIGLRQLQQLLLLHLLLRLLLVLLVARLRAAVRVHLVHVRRSADIRAVQRRSVAAAAAAASRHQQMLADEH